MSKFHFRYQNLLEVKARYEDSKKIELSEAKRRLENEKEKLADFKLDKENNEQYMCEKIQEGTNIAHLKIFHSYVNYLNQKINEQRITVEQCSQEVARTRKELLIASQDKKVFEKLKEKEMKLFKLAEKKAEDLLVDQLVTYKNFKRN
ncbi:MAG TPA: flagellar export protein FliJ [Clostridiales bacterium]|nr:flagellar export protein FliJ [Clostridiales bacterium]